MKLSDMPNIGLVLEKKLISIGVETPEMLRHLGSKEAFLKVRNIDNTACFNTLCALEGAIQEIRWHHLSDNTKQDLKDFFEMLR